MSDGLVPQRGDGFDLGNPGAGGGQEVGNPIEGIMRILGNPQGLLGTNANQTENIRGLMAAAGAFGGNKYLAKYLGSGLASGLGATLLGIAADKLLRRDNPQPQQQPYPYQYRYRGPYQQ